jgi:hypothetical protein
LDGGCHGEFGEPASAAKSQANGVSWLPFAGGSLVESIKIFAQAPIVLPAALLAAKAPTKIARREAADMSACRKP